MLVKKTRKRLKNRDKSRDYVDGPTLQKNLVDWYESGEKEAPMIVYNALLQIINRLASSGKFSGYSYIDEMKEDATVAVLAALMHKKYKINHENPNPFAYFTQIAFNAFINVINIEKKQSYLKHKSLLIHQHESYMNNEQTNKYDDILDYDLIEKFEKKKEKKPKKVKNELANFEGD